MIFHLPNNPLFDKLCENASDKLPTLGFEQCEVSGGILSFKTKDDLVVTIQHRGYNKPHVLFGYKQDNSIIRSWEPLEFYLDHLTPIFKKHLELKSFFDFEFDFELLQSHQDKILGIVKEPAAYLEWQKTYI